MTTRHVAVERVDARLQERVDRRRDDDLAVPAVLAHHREHLLDIERIPGRGGRDALAQPRVERRVGDETAHQLGALVGSQRLEEQRRRIRSSRRPSPAERRAARYARRRAGRSGHPARGRRRAPRGRRRPARPTAGRRRRRPAGARRRVPRAAAGRRAVSPAASCRSPTPARRRSRSRSRRAAST